MKKRWFFILFPIYLFGVNVEERVSILEQEMGQISTMSSNQTFGANFSPDSFHNKRWMSLFIEGEALYWLPKIGGTEYVYELLGGAIGLNVPQIGEVENLHFNWGWGARAGLGFIFSRLNWEFCFRGTWYSTEGKNEQEEHFPTILINLKGAMLPSFSKAYLHHVLSYDEILLKLQKPYFVSRFLSLYTSIGLQKNWINQHLKGDYGFKHDQRYQLKDFCSFEGVGPQVGIGTKWHLFFGFNFSLDMAASLIYGTFEVKHQETFLPLREISLKGKSSLFSPQVNFCLGLGWDFYTQKYHFGVSLNYEALYLWRQNQALQMDEITQSRLQVIRHADDITFYGLGIKLQMSF